MPVRADIARASSRIRLVAGILALVFGAQLTVALGIFMLLPHVPLVLLAVVDAAALALLVTPALWPLTGRAPPAEIAPRARAQDVLDRAGDAILTIDEQGVIQSANAAAEAIFGNPAAGLAGVDVTTILLQSPDRERQAASDPRSLRTGERLVIDRSRDVIGRRADGVTFPAELTVSEVPAGGRRFLTAIIRDVTERRRVEDALRASEERYRRLFDGHPAPLLVYDPGSLRLLAVNEAAVRQYGYTREELLAMTLSELCPVEDIGSFVEHLQKPSVNGARRGTFRHRRKDGSLVRVEVTSHALDFGGRPARLALALDVSQREQPER
jgi:two-component system cell cycle sensor histidine kinase/response regulator CckA